MSVVGVLCLGITCDCPMILTINAGLELSDANVLYVVNTCDYPMILAINA